MGGPVPAALLGAGCVRRRHAVEDGIVRDKIQEGGDLDSLAVAHAEYPDVVVVIRPAVQGHCVAGPVDDHMLAVRPYLPRGWADRGAQAADERGGPRGR